MITFSLLTVTALWFVILHRYPSYFIPRKSVASGENWIEVLPTPRHLEAASMQEVA
jgi:hypothetical protein